jgi:hypothetical protein
MKHIVNTGHFGMHSIPIYTPTETLLMFTDIKLGAIFATIQAGYPVYNGDMVDIDEEHGSVVSVWN